MKRIMVVDDLPDQIFTIKQALENLDDEYEIIGAESGEQCLELLNNGEVPDLILSETRMPGMTGRELLDRLKENPEWKEIPVIFLTAKTDPYSKGFGKMAAAEYIAKPCDIKNLERRIDKVLKKQQLGHAD